MAIFGVPLSTLLHCFSLLLRFYVGHPCSAWPALIALHRAVVRTQKIMKQYSIVVVVVVVAVVVVVEILVLLLVDVRNEQTTQ